MINPRRMNIFGDDESEIEDTQSSQYSENSVNTANSVNSDTTVFYQDVRDSSVSNTNRTSSNTSRRTRDVSYDYDSNYMDDDEYMEYGNVTERTSRHRDNYFGKRKRMRDRYYNTNINDRQNAFRDYHRHNHYNSYDNYRGNAPHFSKEDNSRFVNQIIIAILAVLALVFIFRSDSAYAGVTAVVLIMVVMGNITKKKGNNRK